MLLILQQYGNFGFWGKRKLGKTQQKIGLLPKQTLESPSIHHPKESSYNETNATPHQLMEDSPTYTKIVDSNQSQILQTQFSFFRMILCPTGKCNKATAQRKKHDQYMVAPCSISLSPEANIIRQKNFLLDFVH